MMGMERVALVLGFVVVELFGGHDLADDGGLRVVVAEDGDFELAGALGWLVLRGFAADALLDDDLAVVAGGEHDGGRKLGAVVDLGDADGGAEVRGLDEERIAEVGFDLRDGFARRLLPRAAQQRDVLDDGQAGGGEEALHRRPCPCRRRSRGRRSRRRLCRRARRVPGWCRPRRRCRAARERGHPRQALRPAPAPSRQRSGTCSDAGDARWARARSGSCDAGFREMSGRDRGAAGEHVLRLVREEPAGRSSRCR